MEPPVHHTKEESDEKPPGDAAEHQSFHTSLCSASGNRLTLAPGLSWQPPWLPAFAPRTPTKHRWAE